MSKAQKFDGLTPYQAGQLLYIHFEGEFKYRTDDGTRIAPKAWRGMIDALVNGGYVVCTKRGAELTPKAKTFLDQHAMNIPFLS